MKRPEVGGFEGRGVHWDGEGEWGLGGEGGGLRDEKSRPPRWPGLCSNLLNGWPSSSVPANGVA